MASSWSNTGSLNFMHRNPAGGGTASSAFIAGGYVAGTSDSCEKFNGSTWSNTTAYPRVIAGASGCGASESAGIVVGGYSGGARAETYNWNGTTWTDSTHNFPMGIYNIGIGGSASACIETGYNGGDAVSTYKYNGTSWSEAGDLHANSDSAPCSGTPSAARVAGFDYGSGYNNSEVYNGTSWSTSGDLPGARTGAGSFGASTNMLVFAGSSNVADSGILATSVIWTGSAWAADATGSTAVWTIEGPGSVGDSQTTGLKAGGQDSANHGTLTCEIYNSGITPEVTIKNLTTLFAG